MCGDRATFVTRNDIKALIPRRTWREIRHPQGTTHIGGFTELFALLDTEAALEDLRRLIFKYFAASSYLRPHLSKSLSYRMEHVLKMKIALPVVQGILMPRPLCFLTMLNWTTFVGAISPYAHSD